MHPDQVAARVGMEEQDHALQIIKRLDHTLLWSRWAPNSWTTSLSSMWKE